MPVQAVSVLVLAVLWEEVRDGLVLQDDGKVQRRAVSGCPEVLHQRADGSAEPVEEARGLEDRQPVRVLQARILPSVRRVPGAEDRVDGCLGQLAGAPGVAIPGQGVQRVEPLANLGRQEVDERSADPLPVQRQGDGSLIGEERGAGDGVDRLLVDTDAQGVFGTQQGVEKPARDLRLRVVATEAHPRLGQGQDVEERDAVVVRVEQAAHRPASQADGAGEIGGVYVLQLGHAPSP